jgi:hypothetical protein
MNPKVEDQNKPGTTTVDADPEQKPEITPDEPLGLPAIDFINRSLGLHSRTKKPKAEPKAEPELDAEGNPIEEPPARPKRAPRQRQEPPAAATIDEDKLGEAVGRAVVQAQAQAKAAQELEDEPVIPDDQKQRVTVLREMERKFPDKYKGLPERYLGHQAKLDKYVEDWKKEHPDEEYDPDAEEHVEYQDQLEKELDYEEDDYVDALTDLKLEAKLGDVDRRIEDRLKPIQQKEQIQAHAPKIEAHAQNAAANFLQKFGGDFAEAVKDGKIDADKIAELAGADPDTHAAVEQGAQAAQQYVTEVYLLDHQLTQFDPKKPMHRILMDFETKAEEAMLKRPPSKQRDGQGRAFVGRAEYNQMPPAKRAKHWTFDHEDLSLLITSEIAKQTRTFLKIEDEKFTRRAKAKGLIETELSPVEQSQHLLARRRKQEADEDAKPVSPSTPVGTRVAAPKGKPAAQANGPLEGFVLRALGKA